MMNLTEGQKIDIFYPLQRKATEWMNKTFKNYTCNYQSFCTDRKRVFENFTCIKKEGGVCLVIIVYFIAADLETSTFYTYKHENFE